MICTSSRQEALQDLAEPQLRPSAWPILFEPQGEQRLSKGNPERKVKAALACRAWSDIGKMDMAGQTWMIEWLRFKLYSNMFPYCMYLYTIVMWVGVALKKYALGKTAASRPLNRFAEAKSNSS